MVDSAFVSKYGPWAVVAGASEGIGAAFADALADKGLHVLLLARREGPLDELARALRAKHAVEIRTAKVDLGAPDVAARVAEVVSGLDVGLLVYNAASSVVAPFFDKPIEDRLKEIDVNVRGPVVLTHLLAKSMVDRGRGGVILMSSMSQFTGSALVAHYAATKAYNAVFARGLWYELRRHGVDVLTSIAGATRTPGYDSQMKEKAPNALAAPMAAEDVAKHALADLGKGPTSIPGLNNKIGRFLLGRLLSDSLGTRMVSKATTDLQKPG
jgi:short-subunit dehydrogenase